MTQEQKCAGPRNTPSWAQDTMAVLKRRQSALWQRNQWRRTIKGKRDYKPL